MTSASHDTTRRFVATRAQAVSRLRDFLPRAGRAYAAGRNADHGPDDRRAVSELSPFLRHRLIDEREVVAAVIERHGLQAAEKFVQEVFWRTYWKGWLEAHPDAWTRFLAARDEAREDMSGGLRDAVAEAEAGRTGIDGFDDWAEELFATGYLHNHARMWFASIWIFTLRLPWVLGADFFLRHLVDADPASNTLSWRWVAGLQTKGKTYLATPGNIARYTDGRFEPRGLARTADALIEPALPKARPLRRLPPPPSGRPALLLVTPDDLSPETFLSDLPIAGVACVCGTDGWPWESKARDFVGDATEDAAHRAQAAFRCKITSATHLDAEAIVEAAQAAGARHIVTAYAPVGPIADALAALDAPLAEANLPLNRVRRSWDERFWPHATKGFFGLKKQIRDGLAQDGLAS